MEALVELSGFAAAHGVQSVGAGGPLTPFVGFERQDGSRELAPMTAERLEDGVRLGQEWLRDNPQSAVRAVLVYDGYVNLASGQVDALVVQGVEYEGDRPELFVAVPYKRDDGESGFLVELPEVLHLDQGDEQFEFTEAFFHGVEGNPEASLFWLQNLAPED